VLKVFNCILLAVILVFAPVKNLFWISYFGVNQTYIAENLCIEKDADVNNCQGQCFLENKISEDDSDENNSPESYVLNELLPNIYLENETILEGQAITETNNEIIYKDFYSFNYTNSLFKPPQFC
jgi:hypothetical protein